MNKNNTPPKNYQKHMYVVFDGVIVEDCKPIPLEKVLKEPEIRFDSMKTLNKNKYHLFVIVDKDAMGKFYVHYCIYDIKEDNISSAQLLYHYRNRRPRWELENITISVYCMNIRFLWIKASSEK